MYLSFLINTDRYILLITLYNVINHQIRDNYIKGRIADQVIQKKYYHDLPALLFDKSLETFFFK